MIYEVAVVSGLKHNLLSIMNSVTKILVLDSLMQLVLFQMEKIM